MYVCFEFIGVCKMICREELEEEPSTECEPLADLGLQVTPRHPQQEDSKAAGIDVKDVAYVRFVPSAKNPHPDFADELYFPPIDEESHQLPADFAVSNGTEAPRFYLWRICWQLFFLCRFGLSL